MAHRTRYRDTASNIKVLLRQQTSMTLNERFHKIMKMPAPPPPRPHTPPPRQPDRTDDRMRTELRQHQRKLEQLERSALQMMSRSLTVPTIAPVAPAQPIYEPPKPSAKARLGMSQRLGAKKLSQKYAKSRLGPKRLSNASAPVPTPRVRATVTPRGRSSMRGGRGGGVTRATTAASKAVTGSPAGRGKGRVKAVRGGRGGRGGGKPVEPKKEDLDSELDKYMSNSKVYLDNQLVDYMAQKEKDATKS